jgi:hypothetical protein
VVRQHRAHRLVKVSHRLFRHRRRSKALLRTP